ncbi:hypothetical protein B0H11DRAFT_1921666 [Mycena galericulata]|nr:hypothetical protein B0H11DRAFT_1921666 [Mycena galericulata]
MPPVVDDHYSDDDDIAELAALLDGVTLTGDAPPRTSVLPSPANSSRESMPPVVDDNYSDDDDLAELAAFLDGVTLTGDAPPPLRPPTPPRTSVLPSPANSSRPQPNLLRTPPPSPAPSTAPSTPRNRFRLYHFHTPERDGFTTEWSEAAALTQGVANASTRRVTKKHKPRRKKRAYAVFYGRRPGVYATWASVSPLVTGIPGAIFQGYRTMAAAEAAFEYARAKTWTRLLETRSPQPPIPRLPDATQFLDESNPLHKPDGWYIVYCGIAPGVYRSSLECSLNTIGLSGATFDSVEGRDDAVNLYQSALRRGDVRILRHPYFR